MKELLVSISLKEGLYSSVLNTQIMDLRADIVSTLLIIALVVGDYWLLRSGAIDFAMFVQTIVGGSVVAIFAIFWWAWGDRITQFLKGSNKMDDQSQHKSENIRQLSEEEELNLLIKPLYCEFEKYRDMPNDPINNLLSPYKGLARALSLVKWVDPDSKFSKSYGVDRVDYVLDILRKHADLAQPELKELIAQYLEIRQKRAESVLTSDQDFQKTYDIANQIGILVKARYDELMWGKKKS